MAALIAGVTAATGSAASFDDTQPCPASGPLLVCPTMHVGVAVNLQLLGKNGCNLYRWEYTNGSLPQGLTMSSSGLITGTPTREETTQPWMIIHDLLPSEGGYPWCGGDNQSQRQFVFTVVGGSGGAPPPAPPPPPSPPKPPPPPPVTITSSSVPGGEVDVAYGVTVTATGGVSAKAFSVSGGALPPGLTLSPDGHISGTPTTAGAYDFTVTVHSGASSASKSLRIDVIPGIIVSSSPVVPPGEVRAPYKASVATILGLTGGAPPYRFVPVSGFPFGIGFDPSAGTIFGLPRQAGTLSLTISIVDANKATKQVTLQLEVLPRIHIVPIDLHRGHVRRTYHATVAVTGGQDPVWTISVGTLPPGLSIDPTTGVISGVPRKRGTFPFVVSVHDALGATVAIRYWLKIVR